MTVVLGLALYGRGTKMQHRVLGIIATVGTMLPVGLAMGLYAIPYLVLSENMFSGVMDWVFVFFPLLGIAYFILSIAKLLENGLIHLGISVVFLGIGYLFVRRLLLLDPELLTFTSIAGVYGFN